jgi:branched-chain amino acid transport system substrate-binding protein
MGRKGLMVTISFVLTLMLGSGQLFAAPVVEKWEIPFINTWTGAGAGYGVLCSWFAEQGQEDINTAGGIAGRPLSLQKCDDALDPTRAASCMKSAVEKSLVVLGPMSGTPTQIAAPIAARAGVMCIAPVGGHENVLPARPWAVVLSLSDKRRGDFAMNTWLKLNPDIKAVVILRNPVIATWKKYSDIQKEILEKMGIKVSDVIDVATGAVDVSSVVIRALGAKPDGIVTHIHAPDTFRIVSELDRRGFKKKERIIGHPASKDPVLFTMSGSAGNLMDGMYLEDGAPPVDTPLQKNLLERFRKVEGQQKATFLHWGNSFYVGVYLIKDAIEKTGVTGDPAKLKEERIKIRDYINNVKNFDSKLYGPISALPDGSFEAPYYLYQIKDNKPVLATSSRGYKFKE